MSCSSRAVGFPSAALSASSARFARVVASFGVSTPSETKRATIFFVVSASPIATGIAGAAGVAGAAIAAASPAGVAGAAGTTGTAGTAGAAGATGAAGAAAAGAAIAAASPTLGDAASAAVTAADSRADCARASFSVVGTPATACTTNGTPADDLTVVGTPVANGLNTSRSAVALFPTKSVSSIVGEKYSLLYSWCSRSAVELRERRGRRVRFTGAAQHAASDFFFALQA